MTPHSIPERPAASHKALSGGQVLLIALLFFGTIGAVDALMVYYAISTFRGENDPKAYEHGLAYGKDIAAADAQNARRWQVDGTAARRSDSGVADVAFTLKDAEGRALTGLDVRVALAFPTDKSRDRVLSLAEMGGGLYRGSAVIPAGQWDLSMEAARGSEILFRSRSRVNLP